MRIMRVIMVTDPPPSTLAHGRGTERLTNYMRELMVIKPTGHRSPSPTLRMMRRQGWIWFQNRWLWTKWWIHAVRRKLVLFGATFPRPTNYSRRKGKVTTTSYMSWNHKQIAGTFQTVPNAWHASYMQINCAKISIHCQKRWDLIEKRDIISTIEDLTRMQKGLILKNKQKWRTVAPKTWSKNWRNALIREIF